MASATKSADDDEGAKAKPAKAKGGRGPMLLVLAAAMIAAAMASGATWFLTGRHAPAKEASSESAAPGEDDKSKPEQPALYLEMTPAFVVNMADEDSQRFLQVEVQLMARDQKIIDAAKSNMPRIRNALMLLFGQQHSRDIGSRAAKEALQKQALDEVNKVLKEERTPAGADALYFTSLVMQ